MSKTFKELPIAIHQYLKKSSHQPIYPCRSDGVGVVVVVVVDGSFAVAAVFVTVVVSVFSPKTLWPTLAAKNKPVRVIYAVGISGNVADLVCIVLYPITKSKEAHNVNVHTQLKSLVVDPPLSSLKKDLNQLHVSFFVISVLIPFDVLYLIPISYRKE